MLNYGPTWAVVTPWLNSDTEYCLRFVGSGEQCMDYRRENYGPTDDYATIVQLPEDITAYNRDIVFRAGQIVSKGITRPC